MVEVPKKVKLFWIEEQEIFQNLYKAIFTLESPVEVMGSSLQADYASIRTYLSKFSPDVVLIGCKCISPELIRELVKIRADFPGIGIFLMVSYLKHNDVILLNQFIDKTPERFGFLFKNSLTHSEQLFSLLNLVGMGQSLIDPTLTHILTDDREESPIAKELTARELEILNLVSRGLTNVAISDKLCIDVKTVRHHINNLYSKLKMSQEFDNRHPRVSATNAYLRLTGQLSFYDRNIES